MLRRLCHALVALGFAAIVSALPVERVAACSCVETNLVEAIGRADAAFVGSLLGQSGPAANEWRALGMHEWIWAVERTREALGSDRVGVAAWPDDGGNCGVAFAPGERWLVLADVRDGRLETNGCMPNHRMDGTDPDTEALVVDLVALTVEPGTAPDPPIPVPVLIAGAVSALLLLVGLVAFRHERA
jgi:hypothetical protein